MLCVGAQMDEVVAPEGQLRGAGDPAAFIADPSDREAWAAQLMRSIDSDSAAGLPTGAKACALGLDCGARILHLITLEPFVLNPSFLSKPALPPSPLAVLAQPGASRLGGADDILHWSPSCHAAALKYYVLCKTLPNVPPALSCPAHLGTDGAPNHMGYMMAQVLKGWMTHPGSALVQARARRSTRPSTRAT